MLSDENKLRIFSGNANPDLAREIAAYLGTTVGDAVINRFNNGEVQVMKACAAKIFSSCNLPVARPLMITLWNF